MGRKKKRKTLETRDERRNKVKKFDKEGSMVGRRVREDKNRDDNKSREWRTHRRRKSRGGACANERRKGGIGKDPKGRREHENILMFTMERKVRWDKNKEEKENKDKTVSFNVV